MSTSTHSITWIENLADQEVSIRAGERSSIDLCTTKEEVLGAETATFAHSIFAHLSYLVKLFNDRVSDGLQIRLSQSSEGIQSFWIGRNRMKLFLCMPQPGVLQLQCTKLIDEEIRSQKSSVMFSGLVEASFETFHDVQWNFLGSRVSAEQVALHYLTEFIQVSREDRSDS